MLVRRLMAFDASGGAAILHSVYLVSILIGSAHGRLHAAVGEKASKDDILYTILAEKKIEVGRGEGAEAGLALCDKVAGGRLHGFVEIRSPLTSHEGLALLDGGENAVRHAGNLLVTFLEVDGNVDDGASG